MNLVEALKNLGLNEKEARIYLALLQLGKSTAYNIATRSGLKKPTTYVILQQLIEKGFVINVPRAKKQLFIAESPDECITIAKEKLKMTERELPELMAIKKKREQRFNVAYFEGLAGIREAHNKLIKIMKAKPEGKRRYIGFYAKTENLDSDFEKFSDELGKSYVKYNIKRRAITAYNNLIAQKYLSAISKFGISDIKAVNEKKYSSYISIEAYDNFVQIISQRNLQAIVIEDRDVADAVRQIFEMAWELVDKDEENYLKFSSVDN